MVTAVALVVPPLGTERAAAADPTVTVELAQSSTESRIGSALTLTAAVHWSGGSTPLPGDGWWVEFSGDGDGDWSSGPVRTDHNRATYVRTTPIEQTEQITARLVNSGCGATSNTVQHVWWQEHLTLTEDARSAVNSGFTFRGRATRGSAPIVGAAVSLTVDNLTDDAAVPVAATNTDDNGNFAVTWNATSESFESVHVRITWAGPAIARETTHVWFAAHPATDALSIFVPRAVRSGTVVRVEAELRRNAVLVSGPPVTFLTAGGWLAPNQAANSTRPGYEFPVTIGPGQSAMAVTATSTGPVGTTTQWWVPSIEFVSPTSQSITGQTYNATVIYSHDGIPIPGTLLEFIIDGSELGPVVRTDANGRASIPLVSATPGSETISVTEAGSPLDAVSAQTTHAWVAPPGGPVIVTRVAPASQTIRDGDSATVTATVSGGANPLQGWDVAFDGFGPTRTATTDAQGRASVTLRSEDERYSVITASVGVSGCDVLSSDVAVVEWTLPTLDLNPKNTTSPARQPVTFTADLSWLDASEDTVPIQGDLVRFTMRSQSCDLPIRVEVDRTRSNGRASVSLTRDGPSIDSVTAEEIGVVQPASDTTGHTWGSPDPPPLSMTIDQSTAESRAGSAVTVSATVHDSDRPRGLAAAGVRVGFLGLPPDAPDSALTNADGVASVTFTGTGTSSVALGATTAYGCGLVVSPTITHRWYVPELRLTRPRRNEPDRNHGDRDRPTQPRHERRGRSADRADHR